MKNLIAALFIFTATTAYADFSSTWILQRTIITDEHKVFDTSLDDHILIGGVMKVVNDEYELKGLMCDQRNDECVKIVESLNILALDREGLWADASDENGNEFTVHILNRTPRSGEPLNLFFTDTAWGMTTSHSFRLIGHHEELPDFEFERGVSILEDKMMLDQMYSNE